MFLCEPPCVSCYLMPVEGLVLLPVVYSNMLFYASLCTNSQRYLMDR